MLSEEGVKFAPVRTAFCYLVAHWRLTQGELRGLLGIAESRIPEHRVLPDFVDADAETRMRLLLRLDAALGSLLGGAADIGDALREPDAAGHLRLITWPRF